MRVRLHWTRIDHDERHELWNASPVLYAYVHRREILYIGKADGSSTARSRLRASDKQNLYDYLDERRIDAFRVLVGEFHFDGRLTRQMVVDVESLLIALVEPRGNISATRSRITRPGMHVRCTGAHWPSVSRHFIDG